MKHFNINLNSAVVAWLQVAALVFASFAPFLLSAQRVDAAQLDGRSIAISDSRVSATGVTYTNTFQLVDSVADFEGYIIEFCDNDPLPGVTCASVSEGVNVPDMDIDNDGDISDDITWTIEVDADGDFSAGATDETANWSLDEENVTDTVRSNGYIFAIEHSTTANYTATPYVRVTIDGVVNPSDTSGANNFGSFYARLYADDDADAQAVSGGTWEDDGGIAMSTVDTLTITARVQEILEFCVGDTDTPGTDDCDDISGNDIDMGVLDSTSVNLASAEDSNAYAMLRTNAANGAVISYFADAGRDVNDDGGGGVNGGNDTNDGFLSYAGADCTTPAAQTDACINSPGSTETAFVNGTENFGMTISSVDISNGSTANLVRDTDYDNDIGYAFVAADLTADTIASSSTVVDDEMLVLDFAGTAAITTPTGIYNTSVVYIATATF